MTTALSSTNREEPGELRKKGEGKRHSGAQKHIRLFLGREQFASAEGLGSAVTRSSNRLIEARIFHQTANSDFLLQRLGPMVSLLQGADQLEQLFALHRFIRNGHG